MVVASFSLWLVMEKRRILNSWLIALSKMVVASLSWRWQREDKFRNFYARCLAIGMRIIHLFLKRSRERFLQQNLTINNFHLLGWLEIDLFEISCFNLRHCSDDFYKKSNLDFSILISFENRFICLKCLQTFASDFTLSFFLQL